MSEKLPTEAMIEAGCNAYLASKKNDDVPGTFAAIWRAMQAARPTEDAVERVARAGNALLGLAANGRPGLIAAQIAEWEATIAALTDTTKDAAHD